jgi:hypothetical protein
MDAFLRSQTARFNSNHALPRLMTPMTANNITGSNPFDAPPSSQSEDLAISSNVVKDYTRELSTLMNRMPHDLLLTPMIALLTPMIAGLIQPPPPTVKKTCAGHLPFPRPPSIPLQAILLIPFSRRTSL